MSILKTPNLILILCTLLMLIFTGFFFTAQSKIDSDKAFKDEAQRIVDVCADRNKGNCYEEEFTTLAKNNDLFFAEHTLYALQDIDPVVRRCHLLSHFISKAATREHPEKWEEYLETVNITTCSAGFFHGVLEVHIGDNPDFKLTPEFINTICFKGDFYKKQNCVHFMGHLLMIEYGGEVDLALDGCEGINEELYKRCYTGVFMEDSFPLALVEHKIRKQLTNRFDPKFTEQQTKRCLRYERDRAVACWTDMGENFGVRYNDPQRVYESCRQAPLETARRMCFLKASGLFAIHPHYATTEKLVSICTPARDNEDLYKNCVGWTVSSLVYYSPKFSERATSFCSSIEEWFRDGCFELLARQIKTIGSQSGLGVKQFCQALPPEHKYLCLN